MKDKLLKAIEQEFPYCPDTDYEIGYQNGLSMAKAIVLKLFAKDTNVLTNADRIRAMSDEELADFICGIYDDDEYFGKFINGLLIPCYDQYKIAEWLKQPAED